MNHLEKKESELFRNSLFVLKIKGYRFHSYYIFEDTIKSLGKPIQISYCLLDEDKLRKYRKEHGEYEFEREGEIVIFEFKNLEIGLIKHESGTEVFLLGVLTGVITNAIYDLIKYFVTESIKRTVERNKEYSSNQDAEISPILIITPKCTLKIGEVKKLSPTLFKENYIISEKDLTKLLDKLSKVQDLKELDKQSLELINEKLLYKEGED